MSWAKIVDCGDVRMTFLDNTVALKQLDRAHEVTYCYLIQLANPLIKRVDRFWEAVKCH